MLRSVKMISNKDDENDIVDDHDDDGDIDDGDDDDDDDDEYKGISLGSGNMLPDL